MKMTPLTFTDFRDAIISDENTVTVTTPEYQYMGSSSSGRHVVGVTGSGQVDVLDAVTGQMIGTCHEHMESAIQTVQINPRSDFVAIVNPPFITLLTTSKRRPAVTFPYLSKSLLCIAFVPPSNENGVATTL